MTATNGKNFEKKKSKCKFRKTRIIEDTRTSGGGRFYDQCCLTHQECKRMDCISTGGE